MALRSPVELAPRERTLRDAPLRVLAFLRGVSSHAQIRILLESAGYGRAAHEEALALLGSSCPYGSGGLDPAADDRARSAAAEVGAWVRTHFPRFRTTLERLHPEHSNLFSVIGGRDDARALLDAATTLERLGALAAQVPTSPVVRTLALRGLSAKERMRVAELVALAQCAALPNELEETDGAQGAALSDDDAEREAALSKLYAWHRDWGATARALIRRKDWLIALGLAERGR